jgi:DNA repair exonuclease SbcCD nuclease subunit
MRFIHTADLHLGKTFAGMGDKGDALRAGQFETLERIAALAKTEQVDFVVVAGDLFDSNEVRRKTVSKAGQILGVIDPIPVLVLPGTHDVLDEGSVYHNEAFRVFPNIKVFGVDGPTITIGDAAVHGRANDSKQGGVRPLLELKPDPSAAYNIAVLHASMEIEGKSNPEDYLVSSEELSSSGMDYIALGHWHRKSEFSSGATTAWYCGAPEPTKYDEGDGAGQVLLVELSSGGADVKAVDVASYTWLDETLDVAMCPPGNPLDSEIRSRAGDRTILRLRLNGTLNEGEELSAQALEDEFADKYFHLEIDDSKVGYPLEDVDGLFPDGTIGALFVTRLKESIAGTADEDERALMEKALARGAGYISGKLEV